MTLYKLYKNLKKPLNNSQFTFSAKRLNNSYDHFIGINGKDHLSLLFSTSKPFGKNVNIQNLKLNHGITATIRINKKNIKKKFSILSCTSNNENLREIFLSSMENTISNLPKNLSEKEVYEKTKNLIELYNKIAKNRDKDLIGFWGELFVILFINKVDKFLKAWHPNLSDNFDFYDNNQALEVKTTQSNDRKHTFSYEQLNNKFNNIIIGSVMIRKSRSGKSLFDLKKEIEKKIRDKDNKKKLYEIYLTTIGLKSQDELNKIKYDFKYAKDNIKFFDSKFVPRIKEIPMRGLSKIKFESNLNSCEEIEDISNFKIFT